MIIQCPQCSSRYNASMKTPGDSIHCRCGMDFHVPELPNLARSWNCPNCGGSVDPNESCCEYCEAYLAFARCPACFSIAPYDEAKHCAECGESLTLPVKLSSHQDQKMPCPRCKGDLLRKIIDKNAVDLCKDCGGVWLEHHKVADILGSEKINTPAPSGKNPILQTTQKLPKQAVCYLACPECSDIMNRHNFMHNSNIILDQCNTHGVWFDKFELAAAMDYIHSRLDRPSTKNKNATNSYLTKDDTPKLTAEKSNREEYETFEIKDEDLQLLLEEFPEWTKLKKG